MRVILTKTCMLYTYIFHCHSAQKQLWTSIYDKYSAQHNWPKHNAGVKKQSLWSSYIFFKENLNRNLILCCQAQFMHFVSSWMVTHEIMPFWVGILNGKSSSPFSLELLPIKKPSHLWKPNNTNYPLVSTCQKAVNTEHYPHLNWPWKTGLHSSHYLVYTTLTSIFELEWVENSCSINAVILIVQLNIEITQKLTINVKCIINTYSNICKPRPCICYRLLCQKDLIVWKSDSSLSVMASRVP